MKSFILLLSLLCILSNYMQAQAPKGNPGIYQIKNYGAVTDSSNMQQVWYKDSLVIIPLTSYFKYDSSDVELYRGFDIYKYVFINLRTGICQDYYAYSDTATAGPRYKLSDNCHRIPSFGGVGFFCNAATLAGAGDTRVSNFRYPADLGMAAKTVLSDTVLQGKRYKRIKLSGTMDTTNYRFEYIHYLAEQHGIPPLLLSKCMVLEQHYPGYSLERIEYRSTAPMRDSGTAQISSIQSGLSKAEEKIFYQWQLNAASSKAPLLNCTELSRVFTLPIHLRNNPRFQSLNPAHWNSVQYLK